MASYIKFVLAFLGLCTITYVQSANVGLELFFDNFLKAALLQNKNVIDPFKLDNIILDFGPHLGPFRIDGHAKLFNISLRGLSSIKRTGKMVQSKSFDGASKKTIVRMTVGPLNFTSKGVASFAGVAINRNYLGTIERMDCVTSLVGHKANQSIRISNYNIIELVGLRLKSLDRKFIDPVTNRLISAVMGMLRGRVTRAMQSSLKIIIEDKINELPPAMKAMMIN